MKKIQHFMVAAIFFVFCYQGFVSAMMTEQKNLSALTNEADLIIIGSVYEVNSHWNVKHDLIVTDVSVLVNDTLKGKNEKNAIVFTIPGGTVYNTTLAVEDTPVFAPNTDTKMGFFLNTTPESETGYFEFIGAIDLSPGKISGRIERINDDNSQTTITDNFKAAVSGMMAGNESEALLFESNPLSKERDDKSVNETIQPVPSGNHGAPLSTGITCISIFCAALALTRIRI
jgi:hypothetical protein